MATAVTPPFRGAIIVDTPSLIDMEMPINPRFLLKLENPPRTYLDLLPALARQGYEIIIPETSAYESASILAGGINLNTYFNHFNSQHRRSNPFWRHEKLIGFLKEACEGHYPNITVVRTPSQTNMGEILDALRQQSASLDAQTNRDTSLYRDGVNNLKRIQQRKMPGDVSEVMGQLFDAQKESPATQQRPVFLLSSNHKRMEYIAARHPRVGMLTLRGMLSAITRNSSMARYVGFSNTARSIDMALDIKSQIEGLSAGVSSGHLSDVDVTGEIYLKQREPLKQQGIKPNSHAIKDNAPHAEVDRDLPFGFNLSKVSVPQEQLPKLKQEPKGPKYGKPMADGFIPRKDDPGEDDRAEGPGWQGCLDQSSRTPRKWRG